MNARVLLNTALGMLLAGSVVMAGSLIWLATAEPDVLASAHIHRGLTGVVLAVAGRALAAIW